MDLQLSHSCVKRLWAQILNQDHDSLKTSRHSNKIMLIVVNNFIIKPLSVIPNS